MVRCKAAAVSLPLCSPSHQVKEQSPFHLAILILVRFLTMVLLHAGVPGLKVDLVMEGLLLPHRRNLQILWVRIEVRNQSRVAINTRVLFLTMVPQSAGATARRANLAKVASLPPPHPHQSQEFLLRSNQLHLPRAMATLAHCSAKALLSVGEWP